MSVSNAFEAALLDLIFLNTDIPLVARGLVSAGSYYIALHTADPGEAGDQTTNEIAYTNYTRVAVPKNGTYFVRSGSAPTQISNVLAISFPTCGVTGATATHWSIGVAASGASMTMWYGALNAPLVISNGLAPVFGAGAFINTVD